MRKARLPSHLPPSTGASVSTRPSPQLALANTFTHTHTYTRAHISSQCRLFESYSDRALLLFVHGAQTSLTLNIIHTSVPHLLASTACFHRSLVSHEPNQQHPSQTKHRPVHRAHHTHALRSWRSSPLGAAKPPRPRPSLYPNERTASPAPCLQCSHSSHRVYRCSC